MFGGVMGGRCPSPSPSPGGHGHAHGLTRVGGTPIMPGATPPRCRGSTAISLMKVGGRGGTVAPALALGGGGDVTKVVATFAGGP